LTQPRVRGTTYTELPHRANALCAVLTATSRLIVKNAGSKRQPYRREALDCWRSIKNQGEVRLNANKIRMSGARRADVTGVGAWKPPSRGIGIGNISGQQGRHPVEVGLLFV
jgi:hypothetical protein